MRLGPKLYVNQCLLFCETFTSTCFLWLSTRFMTLAINFRKYNRNKMYYRGEKGFGTLGN